MRSVWDEVRGQVRGQAEDQVRGRVKKGARTGVWWLVWWQGFLVFNRIEDPVRDRVWSEVKDHA